MSFAIWHQKPPFAEGDLSPGEKIYKVGAVWVVTDDPARATQEEVDAVMHPEPMPDKTPEEKLAALGLTPEDIKAVVA